MPDDQAPRDTNASNSSDAGSPVYRITTIGKAEDGGLATVQSNVYMPEDEFSAHYLGQDRSVNAIRPPYDLKTLDRLSQENNALGPCVEAMVTNVDGTGFDILRDAPGSDKDDGQNDDPAATELLEFFDEPWPGESFITQRKAMRRDIHRIGNAYLEVLRNAQDEIVFTRPADSKMMRLIKLDEAQTYPVTVRRKGRDVTLNLQQRFRRFVQIVNGVHLRYFKEFGCPIDLDKYTGAWAKKGERLNAQRRATEIIHFTDLPDATSPYGVPRWISQLPSVLGSRKAEEFNMEFFDNGGVPPVLIILQGGVLASESRRAFETNTGGPAQQKQRVRIIEMEPSGGSIDNPGTAKVTVERFGAERQNDSMFEKYDERCEIRVRRGFRLPPIFVGQASDYSFATAFASYTVAEAQVFRPEREEFDEIMSVKVLPAMGYPGYRMASRPMQIMDATMKLNGITLASNTGYVSPKEVVDAVNETVGTSLQVSPTIQRPDMVSTPTNNGDEVSTPPKKTPKKRSTEPSSNGDGTTRKKPVDNKANPTPTKQPKVTKSEDDAELAFAQLLKATQDQDANGFQSAINLLRELDDEGSEEFMALLSDITSMVASSK